MQPPTATDRDDPHKYLDPVALAKVRSLEIQARLIVEGFLTPSRHAIARRMRMSAVLRRYRHAHA